MVHPRDNIIVLPNAHLRQRSKKVGLITKDVQKIISDMESALLDWEESRQHEVGVALAAIQIDSPLKIIIIRSNHEDKDDKSFRIFINPTITKYEGNMELDFEGCLSVKDVYGKVPRYTKVRVKARNLAGKEIRLKAEGFLARTFQHEVDHTNGIVFIDHIKNTKEAFFKLNSEGSLEQLDDKKVRSNRILWQ